MILKNIILVFSIRLASLYLSTILINRIAVHILLSSSLILGSVVYERLFQLSILSQSLLILCGFSLINEYNNLFSLISSFQDNLLATTVIIYSNAGTDKSRILLDNKGKTGIYLWTHKESGKIYIGSAVDLSNRLKNYFNKSYINQNKNMYINKALLCHGYSSFSLTILEYIDISNLSKENARKLILEREQYYIDSLFPHYDINPTAGSRLGSQHTEETKSFMKKIKIGENNPMFGFIHSAESKAKMKKPRSEETKAKMKKPKTEETKTRMSIAKGGGTIYIYDTNNSLVNTFNSTRKATEFTNCSHVTITKYIKSGKLFKDKWIFSLILK